METLHIQGINADSVLVAAPGQTDGVRVSLRALGTSGRVQWLLDGRWFAESEGGHPFLQVFSTPGRHELTALADSGAWDSLKFAILEPQPQPCASCAAPAATPASSGQLR